MTRKKKPDRLPELYDGWVIFDTKMQRPIGETFHVEPKMAWGNFLRLMRELNKDDRPKQFYEGAGYCLRECRLSVLSAEAMK